MANDVERQPLDLSVFSQNLQQHVSPEAPEKMKMMAAQGMVPAPPGETVRLLYQLHFEAEGKVQQAIDSAIADMPENVLTGVVEDEDHGGVLDWIADKRGETRSIVETLLRNKATDDLTVAGLAEQADAKTCEIIATNEVRVLETPRIIEELYQNPNARMATVDQLIELAERNDVDLAQFAGLQRALQSRKAAQETDKEGIDEDKFSEMLEEQYEQAEEEEELLKQLEDDDLTRSQKERLREEIEEKLEEDGEPEADEKDRGILTHGDLMEMTIPQKIRLATVGSRSAVKKLVQDSNKLVHMAAIESPRLKSPDARQFATRKSVPDAVLSYIANNREWTQNYEVVKSLVFNPKTPVSDSMDLLKRLRKNDLQQLEDSREVPHQIARAAKRLLKKRRGR